MSQARNVLLVTLERRGLNTRLVGLTFSLFCKGRHWASHLRTSWIWSFYWDQANRIGEYGPSIPHSHIRNHQNRKKFKRSCITIYNYRSWETEWESASLFHLRLYLTELSPRKLKRVVFSTHLTLLISHEIQEWGSCHVNKRTGRKSESLPVGIEKKLWWRLLAPCVELFVKKKSVFFFACFCSGSHISFSFKGCRRVRKSLTCWWWWARYRYEKACHLSYLPR